MSSQPPPPRQLVEDLLAIRQWSARNNAPPGVEVDTINLLIGNGASPITLGFAGAIRVDFLSQISGAFIQEIDGITGSVVIEVWSFFGGSAPTPISVTGGVPIQIINDRYVEWDTSLWQLRINRGSYLLFDVQAMTNFTRLIVNLRIKRLEP